MIFQEAIEKFESAKVLVIGDIMLDHYIWGEASRLSPEAPVPIVDVKNESVMLGGAANVFGNVISFSDNAFLCGVIGTDKVGDEVMALHNLDSLSGIVRHPDIQTIKKTRVIAGNQQIVRIDREGKRVIPNECEEPLLKWLDYNFNDFDIVVVSDYNKGMITPKLLEWIRSKVSQQHLSSGSQVPIIIDSKSGCRQRFNGATIITPNKREAEIVTGSKINSLNDVHNVSRELMDGCNCEAVLITLGEMGMALFEQNNEFTILPSIAKEVFDVSGAGDTVVAIMALGIASGLSYKESANLANTAAGVVVGRVGTAIITKHDLMRSINEI